jgi:hypothetical protein
VQDIYQQTYPASSQTGSASTATAPLDTEGRRLHEAVT